MINQKVVSDKVRIDKWLWAVRIFKSRTLASNVCKTGKVRVKDRVVKASYQVSIGETLTVRKNGFILTFLVKDIIKKRVSATLAAPCYEDLTSDEEKNKFKDWYVGKAASEKRERGTGRPTKRDRRNIEDYKEDFYIEMDFDDE